VCMGQWKCAGQWMTVDDRMYGMDGTCMESQPEPVEWAYGSEWPPCWFKLFVVRVNAPPCDCKCIVGCRCHTARCH